MLSGGGGRLKLDALSPQKPALPPSDLRDFFHKALTNLFHSFYRAVVPTRSYGAVVLTAEQFPDILRPNRNIFVRVCRSVPKYLHVTEVFFRIVKSTALPTGTAQFLY